MNQGGVGPSIIFIVITAVICSFTSCLLIRCSHLLKLDSYQELATHICGTPGRIIIIFCQLFFPILILIMYGISVTDNVIEVTNHYFPGTIIADSRPFILFLFLIIFFAPLSFVRDISFLDKFLLVSLMLVVETMIFIMLRLMKFSNITLIHYSTYNFDRSRFVQTISTVCFALTSHHNVLQMYKKSEDKRPKKFYHVIIISHVIIATVIIIMTLFGYGAFNVFISGNLFNYYCQGDTFADITRILFTVTIGLTYPFQIFAAREVIRGLFRSYFSHHHWPHYVTTIILLAISYIIPVFFVDIAFVMELGGSLTAAPIAYILPVIFYMKAYHKTWKPHSLEMVVLWAILIYGTFIIVFSTTFSIYDYLNGRPLIVYRHWCEAYFR